VNFIASFLEGHDELLVALGDVPAAVNDDESGLGAGHGSWRFFFFFCVRDAHARNLRILKRLDADEPLAWRVHRRFTNGGRRGREMREEGLKKTVKRGRHYSAVKKCDICARRCRILQTSALCCIPRRRLSGSSSMLLLWWSFSSHQSRHIISAI